MVNGNDKSSKDLLNLYDKQVIHKNPHPKGGGFLLLWFLLSVAGVARDFVWNTSNHKIFIIKFKMN
jgi:hypothetical protein